MRRAALSIAAAGSAAALLLVLRRRRDPRHRHLAWVARLMAEGVLTWHGLGSGEYVLEREDGGRTSVTIAGQPVELHLPD